MTKKRTLLEREAGKLISAIQKEWHEEIGESYADESMDVMDRAHDLLKACKSNGVVGDILGSKSVTEYLGKDWVDKLPRVNVSIQAFEEMIKTSNL